ncbi:MAG TPA: signal recognition particle-docking protein FtsY, partial [Pseudomonas oleovorans]|nr:signal recognition particle-docking protein FtsY [Pseudomonas oleovorans]
MFGSNDDKKSPADAGAQNPPVTEEKKSLFSWWRKKPATSTPESAPEPVPGVADEAANVPAAEVQETPAPRLDTLPEPQPQPQPQ